MPLRPRRVETQPSCITPPARPGSSQWSMIGRSRPWAYSIARRMSPASATGEPSSLNAMQPAVASSPSSARSLPCRPLVTQPMGSTRASALSAARSSTYSTVPRLSIAGSVLGMAQTVVKPPRTAALVPVSMVSLYSNPGSRRCVWRSMKPGATTRPRASNTRAPAASMPRPTAATRPSRISTSPPSRSTPMAGSMMWPLRISRLLIDCPCPSGRGAPCARRRRC